MFSDILFSFGINPPSNEPFVEKKRNLKKLITDSQEKIIREQVLPGKDPPKTHWDFLLAEMKWMANDFDEEYRIKQNRAKKVVKSLEHYFERKKTERERNNKELVRDRIKKAHDVSKLVKSYWKKIDQIIEYKFVRQKLTMDKHLKFMVAQTEKYALEMVKGLKNNPLNKNQIENNTSAIETDTTVNTSILETPNGIEDNDENTTTVTEASTAESTPVRKTRSGSNNKNKNKRSSNSKRSSTSRGKRKNKDVAGNKEDELEEEKKEEEEEEVKVKVNVKEEKIKVKEEILLPPKSKMSSKKSDNYEEKEEEQKEEEVNDNEDEEDEEDEEDDDDDDEEYGNRRRSKRKPKKKKKTTAATTGSIQLRRSSRLRNSNISESSSISPPPVKRLRTTEKEEEEDNNQEAEEEKVKVKEEVKEKDVEEEETEEEEETKSPQKKKSPVSKRRRSPRIKRNTKSPKKEDTLKEEIIKEEEIHVKEEKIDNNNNSKDNERKESPKKKTPSKRKASSLKRSRKRVKKEESDEDYEVSNSEESDNNNNNNKNNNSNNKMEEEEEEEEEQEEETSKTKSKSKIKTNSPSKTKKNEKMEEEEEEDDGEEENKEKIENENENEEEEEEPEVGKTNEEDNDDNEEDNDEEDDNNNENDEDEEENTKEEEAEEEEEAPIDLSELQKFPVQSNPVPYLLVKTLTMRQYQKEGMDWLISLYDRGMSGILADEMGLGKTLQTIALLSHLACARGIWGPHLIIVPTSTLINWEMEFKRWAPGFHILTYYGSANERKNKRIGWNKGNTFHVCITSYQLVVQDALIFRRKKWFYLILDEAHNIKNYQSQRWQTLLSFYSKRRLLLTGTPLQNSLMELWSLMHFLMPALFRSRDEFKYWFSNPLTQMVEGKESYNKTLIERLHTVIRPFILRRTKSEVESQMPKKYYHLVTCELSKRQSELYEDYISRRATKDTINGGNFMSMMNILMQLRKICNHPDLFEGRSIYAPFAMNGIDYVVPSLLHNIYFGNKIYNIYSKDNNNKDNSKEDNDNIFPSNTNSFKYSLYNFNFVEYEDYSMIDQQLIDELSKPPIDFINENITFMSEREMKSIDQIFHNPEILESYKREREGYKQEYINVKKRMLHINQHRLQLHILYGRKLREIVKVLPSVLQYKITYYDEDTKDKQQQQLQQQQQQQQQQQKHSNNISNNSNYNSIRPLVLNYEQRFNLMFDNICRFVATIVPVLPRHEITCIYPKYGSSDKNIKYNPKELYNVRNEMGYHFWRIRKTLCFPEKWLIQFDCGKLQALAVLLRKLQKEKHKCLIFTQMTHMLDILEYFMNLHSFTYLRLDGSTSIVDRQHKMDRFNSDPKVFCFILSTRSGGLGINLIGADTVIFYDSDWNPAMDAQAQDRAHRIGQTRDVHIYRLVTKQTIEENILKKANAKRQLNQISLEDGQFNMGQYFKNFSYKDVISLIPVNDKDENSKEEEKEETNPNTAVVPKGESAKEVEVYNQIEFINALNAVEDEGDVAAIKGVQAEIENENSDFKETTTTDEDGIYDEEEKRNWINSSNQEYEKLTQSLPKIQQYSLYFHEELDKHQVVNYENLLAHSQEMEEKENTWEEQQALEIELAEEEMMMKDSDIYSLQATQLKPYNEMERMYYNYQNKLKKEMKIKEFTGANWETCKDSNTGYYYYRNIYTSETQWEMPEVIKNREIFLFALQHKYNGLPYEVMKTVYSYLIPYKDQINLSETCEQWNRGYRNTALTVQIIPADGEEEDEDNDDSDNNNIIIKSKEMKNTRYYKSIEDCINNCFPGDKIMIHSGVYYIKNELVITKPVYIYSKGSVIINLLSPITINVKGGGVFMNGLRFLTQNKNFIGAIRIDNGKSVFNNCTISHSSGKGSAIYIRNGCKVDFFKCKISFSPQCGIKIENAKVRIMYSRISDNGNYGIVCLRGYLILLHSYIYDNGNTGVRMYRSTIGHICNNEFNRNQHGSFTTTPQSLPFIYFNNNKYPPIDNSATSYKILNELDIE